MLTTQNQRVTPLKSKMAWDLITWWGPHEHASTFKPAAMETDGKNPNTKQSEKGVSGNHHHRHQSKLEVIFNESIDHVNSWLIPSQEGKFPVRSGGAVGTRTQPWPHFTAERALIMSVEQTRKKLERDQTARRQKSLSSSHEHTHSQQTAPILPSHTHTHTRAVISATGTTKHPLSSSRNVAGCR